MKPCTHIAVNKTILQHHVIKREGRAGEDSEELALLRGVQHGAVAVDRDVRAGGDGDLQVVVAIERRAEHDRGQPTARDSLVKVGPRGRGRGETAQQAARTIVNVRSGWGLDPGLFGCAQKRWSGQ